MLTLDGCRQRLERLLAAMESRGLGLVVLGNPKSIYYFSGAQVDTDRPQALAVLRNGATLLVSVNTLVMNRSLYPKLPFDPVKDLVPVSLTSWGQLLLVASPNAGY